MSFRCVSVTKRSLPGETPRSRERGQGIPSGHYPVLAGAPVTTETGRRFVAAAMKTRSVSGRPGRPRGIE